MAYEDDTAGIREFTSLGLCANPFRTSRSREGETLTMGLEIQAAANSLIAALCDAQIQGDSRVIWVEKSRAIPDYYHLAAVSQAENRLANDEELSIIYVYLPLYMLRIGRIRSALKFLGERIAFRQFDKTLAVWIAEVLANPDEDLKEYEAAKPYLEEFATVFAADSTAALAELFGECVTERDLKAEQRGDERTMSLEPNVDDETDIFEEADGTEGLPPLVDAEEREGKEAALAEYFVSYTKVHLSPVIGRALRVYGLRGLGALGSEFSITKAPRKTFKALTKFASKRFKRVALIYDSFANWHGVPEDQKERFIATLTELRLAMKENGSIVFIAATDEVPDIEEVHRTGASIDWSFPSLTGTEGDPESVSIDVARHWVQSAALQDTDVDGMISALEPLGIKAEGSMDRFIELAAEVIDDAADRGLGALGQ